MKQLWRSPTLRSMAIYGAAGAGFAIANLILARMLPKAEYALFTLVIALGQVGLALAPLGADDMVNRRHLEAGPRFLRRVLSVAVPIGIAFSVIGLVAYKISFPMAIMLGVSTIAGGTLMVAAGQFQSEQRFARSLALIQSPNLVLLVASLWVVALGRHDAWIPVAISTAGYVIAALVGWARLLEERHHKSSRESTFPWREALALAGVNAAGLLLIQLERLIIPYVLPLDELATYGVLAAIAGSIFRVMQMGVGYALIPRLRAAKTVRERRRLLAHEAMLASVIVLLGAATIGIATPFIEVHVLDNKFHLGAALLIAAIVSGVTKLLNAFTKAAVTALAEPHEVMALNILGWLSVAIAIGAAAIGARWGLIGVIYGVALGWFVRAISAFYVTARHLRPVPTGVPAAAEVTPP